jgi:hypothetical protein
MEIRCCGEIFDRGMAPARQVAEPGMCINELLMNPGFRRRNCAASFGLGVQEISIEPRFPFDGFSPGRICPSDTVIVSMFKQPAQQMGLAGPGVALHKQTCRQKFLKV